MTKILFTCLLLSAAFSLSAQDWTLERCVVYALDNNLTVKQAELNTRNVALTLQQDQYNRLPNASAGSSFAYNFGRTIDPTTNAFNNTRIGYNNLSLNAGVTLYAGNRINNQIKQSKFDLQASELDIEDNRQTIALNVATAYLNILLGEEQLANAQTQLDLSQSQLDRTNRLINAGQLAANARLDLEAQVARNEQIRIDTKNSVDISYLNLKQLLQLDPNTPLGLDHPEIEVTGDILVQDFNVQEVYETALTTQPSIAAADVRISSKGLDEKIAQSGYMPTLSAFGSLSSIYSSGAPDFNNPNTDNATLVAQSPILINIAGIDQEIVTYQTEGITFPTQSYGDQLNQNFGQSLGVSVNIPLYSNHRNKINVERARLGVINAELNSRQSKDLLKANVQNAVTSFRAARNAYQASNRSLEATEAAYNDAQRRFDLGAISSFDLNNAVDNLDVARAELTRSKYQLLFNLKVVEFYQGKGF